MIRIARIPLFLALLGIFACTFACTDARPAFQQGTSRSSGPTSHEVFISRVMADPTAVPDDRGEWIELTNAGDSPVDLRDWRLRSGNDAGFVFTTSLVIQSRGTAIVGRDTDPSRNGGVTMALAYSGIALGNGSDWVALQDPSGITVDSVAWNGAPSGSAIVHERPTVAPSITGDANAGAGATDSTSPVAETPLDSPAAQGPPAPAESNASRGAASELVVRMLDVGQGDAILIQNGGSTVLIDGGPKPATLGHHLDALGLNGTTIDAVILTHAHADHYQGLRELFAPRRRITVRYFWENQDPSPNVTLQKLRTAIASRVRAGSLTYRDTDDPCANGEPVCVITLKGGAHLDIMRPMPNGEGPNNRSPAIKLVGADSASFTMWLAGDAEREAIDWFGQEYARTPGMRVNVLKADHHGSCNGVSDRYLDLLRPSLVMASVGDVNDYGHMHDQAKAMYAAQHAEWYRTDENGTITIRAPGTPHSGYRVSIERGGASMNGRSDRRSTQPDCQ